MARLSVDKHVRREQRSVLRPGLIGIEDEVLYDQAAIRRERQAAHRKISGFCSSENMWQIAFSLMMS